MRTSKSRQLCFSNPFFVVVVVVAITKAGTCPTHKRKTPSHLNPSKIDSKIKTVTEQHNC